MPPRTRRSTDGRPPTRRSTRTTKATERLVDEGVPPAAKKARKSPSRSGPVVPISAELAAKYPAPKGKRDPKSRCNGGDGQTFSAEARARGKKNRQAKHYAMALKGINRRGGPITDRGLKKMKLQRLASGEIVPL